MKEKSILRSLILPVILVLLVICALYVGLGKLENTVLFAEAVPETPAATKTITRDGVEYFPRQDITVMMVLGIDRYGPAEASNYHRNEGAADSVMLLIFDETEKCCSVLHLNRDTMLHMDVLGVRGEYAGTAYGQLALAHTYGSGLEDSCENVKNTLMRFLPGMTVDHYVALRMDAIPILNDAVGGVTVTVTDDFSLVNPGITMGELTLRGDQVVDYVRTRKDVGDQDNLTRMRRQREYTENFLKALYACGEGNASFLRRMFESVAPYMVTDCSVNTISSMLERYGDFTLKESLTPEGENTIEDGYYAFRADAESLDQLVLDLFYKPK